MLLGKDRNIYILSYQCRILMFFYHNDQPIRFKTVNEQLASMQKLPSVTEVAVDAIDLNDYDVLLERVI